MSEEATVYILLGGMPTYDEYLHRCLQIRASAAQVNDTWQKINMTTNKNLQYRYLREIGYFS